MRAIYFIWMSSTLLINPLYSQIFRLAEDLLQSEHTIHSTMDIESGDLDGDGDLDLVLAMEGKRNIILFNDGKGYLAEDKDRMLPIIKDYGDHPFLTGEDSEDIIIRDMDGDGDLDLVFVSEDTPYHELLLNDGEGNFRLSSFRFSSSIANAVAVLDVNRDKRPDILVGNKGQNQLYLQQKDGSFQKAETGTYIPVNTDWTQDLKLGDLDGDGDLDIFEGIEKGGCNIYINKRGKFTLAEDRLPKIPLHETRKVVLHDIDQDGDLDAYLCNVGWETGVDLQDRLLINNGKGFFSDETDPRLPSLQRFTLDAVFLDLNDDGRLDFITTGLGIPEANAQAFICQKDGSYMDQTTQFLPTLTYKGGIGCLLVDLNQDGKMDLYLSNHSYEDLILIRSR